MHSIYALCDPGTLNVRYVGRTQHSISARLREHTTKAKATNSDGLCKWIASLGKSPDIVLLATCSDDFVREVEKNWILLFIDNGYDVFNIRDCNGMGKKSKHKAGSCSDPVYFSNIINRLIDEYANINSEPQP